MVNSIFMTLFGVDFQFQCPREETENAQKALNWILMATLLQNDPFFCLGGRGFVQSGPCHILYRFSLGGFPKLFPFPFMMSYEIFHNMSD